MEAAEKLQLALLKEAISLEMLASTGLASSLADGEKVANNTASSPARKGDPAGDAASIVMEDADDCRE